MSVIKLGRRGIKRRLPAARAAMGAAAVAANVARRAEADAVTGAVTSAQNKQRLAELDRLTIFDQDLLDHATLVGIDFVEQFHRFNNAERCAILDFAADFDKRR